MLKEMQTKQLSQWLKDSVNCLIDHQEGCCTYKLDDHLAVCVGWSAGYGDELREGIIQAKDEPDYAINAALKVWTSDSMRTDLDYINAPYYDSGEVIDYSIAIAKNEDYFMLAHDLLEAYHDVEDLVIEENGHIVSNPDLDYEIEGRYGTWYEIDEMKNRDDTYKLYESCDWGDEAGAIVIKVPSVPYVIKKCSMSDERVYVIPKECEVCETFDDIESALEDEGIL